MKFNICPMEQIALRFNMPGAGGPARQRSPIAQRAAAQRAANKISFDDASLHADKRAFCLGNNHFDFKFRRSTNTSVPEKIIEHFGSAFSDAYLQIQVLGSTNDHYTVRIEGMALARINGYPGNVYLAAHEPEGHIGFNLTYASRTIFPYNLLSTKKGLGGRLLCALYNFAQDLSVKRMQFNLEEGREDILRFYYHMDFGRPIFDEDVYFGWEVPVLPTEKVEA